MKNNFRNLFIIVVIIITASIAYSIGVYTKNIIGSSASEISTEIPSEELKSKMEIKNEIPISDSDLTNEAKDVIIITESEAVENEPTLEDIIMNECGLAVIDYIALIDSYEDGNWYAYYICADGDCYTITLKNNHVDKCYQLN